MKTLYLLRHAKAARGDAATSDHERPLTERGRNDAAEIGHILKQRRAALELVVSSSARRALETTAQVLGAFNSQTPYERDESLYMGGPGTLLDRVRSLPDAVSSAMLVGHNPDMQEFARCLCHKETEPYGRSLVDSFPPAALAVLQFGVELWRDLTPGDGKLIDYLVPAKHD